jgi:HEAT repeat protein
MSFNPNFQPYLQAILRRYGDWQDCQDFYTPTQALPLRVQTYLPQSELGDSQQEKKREQMEVLAGLRQYAAKHVLLIGNPGSGKSTALRRLLWEESERCRQARWAQTQATQVPVLLELRDYPGGSVLDWLKQELRSLSLNQEGVQHLLDSQRLLLLFDGLNELPSREGWQQVDTFRRHNPETPMVFTMRKLEAGSDLGIEKKLEMMPLSKAQVRQFIEKRLPGQSEALLRQLQNRLQELAETPLLLKMLCDVFVEGEQIPQNRGELFRKQFSRRYDSFKAPRTSHVSEVSSLYMPDLLQYLAVEMIQGDGSTVIRLQISRIEAERAIAQFLEADGETLLSQKSKEYLEDLLKYQLLQLVTDPDQVEFHHQLFQEYYVAEWLCRWLPKITNEQLKCHYLNYLKWTEAIALMMGLLEDERIITRVVQLALDVDLRLGARLAGEVKPKFQEKTVGLVSSQRLSDGEELPNWLKVELLGETRSEFAVHAIRQLYDTRTDDRLCWSAMEALGKIRADKSVLCLSEIVTNSPDARKREHAVECLAKLASTSAIHKLVEIIQYPDHEIAVSVPKMLRQLEEKQAIPEFIPLLKHSDYVVRGYAAASLSYVGNQEAVPALLEALQDKDEHVVILAAQSLKGIGVLSIDSRLLSTLRHPNYEIRELIVDILGSIGDEQVIPLLLEFLEKVDPLDKKESVRNAILDTLGKLNCGKFTSQLIKALNHKNPWVRRGAAIGLGQYRNDKAIVRLLEALQDSDDEVRSAAKESLIKLGNPKAIPELLKSTSHQESYVRLLATEILGDLGHQEDLSHLIRMLEDEDERVRHSAVYALEKFLDRGLINLSSGLLDKLHQRVKQEEDEWVRDSIVSLLGHLKSENSIEVLAKRLRRDQSGSVRLSAVNALIAIGGDKILQPLKGWGLHNKFYGTTLSSAAELIRQGEIKDVIPRLFDLFDNESNPQDVRRQAADLLVDLQVNEIVPDLLKILNDPVKKDSLLYKRLFKKRQFWHGVDELAKIGNEEAICGLLQALEHSDKDVRLEVFIVLRNLKNDRAIRGLLTALQQDEDSHVRYKAAEELAEIDGVDTSRVLPDLLRLISTVSGEDALTAISGIQQRCQFYNYEIFNQAKVVTQFKGVQKMSESSKYNFSGAVFNHSVRIGDNYGTQVGIQNNYTSGQNFEILLTDYKSFISELQQKHRDIVTEESAMQIIDAEFKAIQSTPRWQNFLELKRLWNGAKKAGLKVGEHFAENNPIGKGAVGFLEGVFEEPK